MCSNCVPQSASAIYENPSCSEIWKEATLPHWQIPMRLCTDTSLLPLFLQDLLSGWHSPAFGSVLCPSYGFISRKGWEHSISILSLVNKFHFSFFLHRTLVSPASTYVGRNWDSTRPLGFRLWLWNWWLTSSRVTGSLLLGENSGVDLHRRETVTCISCLMRPTLFENINVKQYHYG